MKEKNMMTSSCKKIRLILTLSASSLEHGKQDGMGREKRHFGTRVTFHAPFLKKRGDQLQTRDE